MKALAVTSLKRVGKLTNVPTVAEVALLGYEASMWYGVVALARTPQEIVRRLNKENARIVADPVYLDRMTAGDFEPTTSLPSSSPPSSRGRPRSGAKWSRHPAQKPSNRAAVRLSA